MIRDLDRRDFLSTMSAAAVGAAFPSSFPSSNETPDMYGRIAKITAEPGQRNALIDILLEGAAEMPGCLSYVVAKDANDGDAIWVTEVWKSIAHHEDSLSRPSVKQALEQGRPLIASFDERVETEPAGRQGTMSEGTQ